MMTPKMLSLLTGAMLLVLTASPQEPNSPPKDGKDPWAGTTEKGGMPRFSRKASTKVAWVREVAVSTMVGCEMILKEKSCAPIVKVESRNGSYYKVAGESMTLEKLLGGSTEVPPEGTKLYLVRAVYLHPLTGYFAAYFEDGKLFVEHGSLGNFRPPVKRSALVVALPVEPTSVTVRCDMAQ